MLIGHPNGGGEEAVGSESGARGRDQYIDHTSSSRTGWINSGSESH